MAVWAVARRAGPMVMKVKRATEMRVVAAAAGAARVEAAKAEAVRAVRAAVLRVVVTTVWVVMAMAAQTEA